jgi:hypothetical protein
VSPIYAIFIAPKVYYLETEDGRIIYKVKGLTHKTEISRKDFESLLIRKNKVGKFQNK